MNRAERRKKERQYKKEYSKAEKKKEILYKWLDTLTKDKYELIIGEIKRQSVDHGNSVMESVDRCLTALMIEEKITLKELQEIKNNVDHPKHYTNGKYECIDIIEDVTKDLKGLEAVCTANVIKYMWRWKLKNGVEDLKKARWYLNKLIDNTEIREIEETYQTEGMAD